MDTKARILNAAEEFVQTKGLNGFSYLHLADALGIKTSSIHYHFKTKAALALALVERLHDAHVAAFRDLDENVNDPRKRLKRLVDLFQDYVREERFCLCGMMSAEMESTSPEVKAMLQTYFRALQLWISSQFRQLGRKNPATAALQFVSALEGSLLLARLNGNPKLVQRVVGPLVAG